MKDGVNIMYGSNKPNRPLVTLLSLVIFFLFNYPVHAQYVVIDLGTLGGRGSAALSINDAGQIVGHAQNSQKSDWRATSFDPTGAGKNLDLGILGGNESFAYSINNAGQIVGCVQNSHGDRRATLFDPTGAGKNINLGPQQAYYKRSLLV
jgi:uncharacterized membrane protein